MYSILFVDDDSEHLQLGKTFLEKSGSLKIDMTRSATDAIGKIKNTKYDGVISNYQISDMDGLTFLKYIRNHRGQIPFIFFTGMGREELVIEALNNGADFYIQRWENPNVQFTELEHKITLAIEKAQIKIPRKKNEHQITDSSRFLATLMDSLPIPIFYKDTEGKYLGCNSLFEQYIGITCSKMVGKPVYDVFPKDLGDIYKASDQKVIDGGVYHSYETQLKFADGNYHDVILYKSPFYDRNGSVGGLIGTFLDITERKKVEDDLKISKKRLKYIINFLPDATVVIDREGKIIEWNRAIEQMTGLPAKDMLGKGDYEYSIPFYGTRRPVIADLIINPDLEIEENYRLTQKEGDILYAETDISYLHGKKTILWVKASPLYNDKWDIVGAIESIRDITEQKNTENALLVAKEKAEAANHAKSIFISRMSHELRTPLNAILGFTQILRKQTNITKAQKRQLDIMLGSGEHLLGLINDILDVGRIEQQKVVIEKTPFHFIKILNQVIDLTRFRADEKGLELRLEITTPLPDFVQGDERRIRQILLNLLYNAIKFTPKGHITLRAGYEKPGILYCEVIDTGIGISQDKREVIFDPFTQVDEPGKVAEGVGLGLTIVRQLVTLMQGTIQVESELGKGSIFRFKIPLPEETPAEIISPPQQLVITGYEGDRKMLLVVDDNLANSAVLISLLEPLGFEVINAVDGYEAVPMVFKHQPDLIILDLVMPGMDGLDIILALKADSELPAIRIIGSSALATPSTHLKDFVLACDDFIEKPVQIDQLLEKIRLLLGIEWQTYDPAELTITAGEITDEPEKIPPDNVLDSLQQAVRSGDYDGLEQQLDILEKDDPAFRPVCAALQGFISHYDDDGIIRYLDRMRGKNHEDGE